MTNEPTPLSRQNTKYIVVYNIVLAAVMSFGLYQVVMTAAYADLRHQETVATEQKASKTIRQAAPADANTVKVDSPTTAEIKEPGTSAESAETSESSESSIPANLEMIAYVLWAVSLAGGLGGTLSNLRGIFEYYRDYSFIPEHLELPFYIRPVSGVICGLFTFFLARFFTIALSNGEGLSGWQTLEGMLPYIGVALLAGFASQEFMERLRETARTLFGTPPPTQAESTTVIETQNTDATDGGDDSNLIKESVSGAKGRSGSALPGTTTPKSRQIVVVKPSGPIRRVD